MLEGVIRIPIETDLQFQRAFSASFGTLPFAYPLLQWDPIFWTKP